MTLRLIRAVITDGMRGLLRGGLLSVAAVGVIGATFSVAALALLAAENLSAAVRAWGRPDVLRVYLDESATTANASALAIRLAHDPRVVGTQVVSPDEASERFAETYPEMAGLTGLFDESPFPPEVEVSVVPEATEAVRLDLVGRLETQPGVAAVLADDLWTDQLLDASLWVRRTGHGAGLFFAVVAALVVAGVIRISLASRRDGIAVMTVVGAPRAFVAGPFIVEGLALGAAGGVLALAMAWAVYRTAAGAAAHPVASFLAVAFVPPGQAAALVAVGGLAGALAAAWTVRHAGR